MRSISLRQETSAEFQFLVPDYTNNHLLESGTAQDVTVPEGAVYASFSPAVPFWANFNGAAAVVPSVSVTDGTGPEYMPAQRRVHGMATFSVVSALDGFVTVSFYTE
jgi:hypothetical protein